MINKAECYAVAMQEIKTARHIAIEEADALRVCLLADHPELARLEKEMIALSQKKMKISIHSPQQLPALAEEYMQLKQKQEEYLVAIGLSPDAFLPVFQCAVCRDTGVTETGTCDCVKKRAYAKMLKHLCDEFPVDEYTFDSFSVEFYAKEHQKAMKEILDFCVNYAKNFTRKAQSLYLLGNTGLGKTHLTFAMAKEIVAKGYSVIYCTAQTMISALEKEHFGNTDERLRDYYLNCDVLILDDLGTEFLSPVAQSELYNVINHRSLFQLPTIINSNLAPSQIEQRYGERLLSRICGCYHSLHFYGEDVRIQKRLASKKNKKIENNT